jgi:hypothetical protein
MSVPKTTDDVLVGVFQHLADQFITWRSPLSLGNLADLDPSSALINQINQLEALCAFANGTAKSSRREKEKRPRRQKCTILSYKMLLISRSLSDHLINL